jgi:undecaprenyl phosphate-alpha-L-ara4N flippase subunit ArnE
MSAIQTTLIIFTVILLSIGQVLFKIASSDISLIPNKFIFSLLNTKLILAFAIYTFATILWLIALKGVPLRIAYPFIALAFFIVPILAHYLIGEVIYWNTFLGAAFIGVGVFISTYK